MKRLLLVLVALLAHSAPAPGQEPGAANLAVVVGAASSIERVDIATLRDVYLRRRVLLADGSRAVPINLPVGHPARDSFSLQVLGREPAELSSYWDRLYYEGMRPPIVLPSPQAVRQYLQAEERAVGYIPESEVDSSIRVLLVLPSGGAAFSDRRESR